MKSIVLKVFVFCMCAVWLSAQSLRDYVCVVRGNVSEKNEQFLTNVQDSLERNGYTYYAKYIGSFLKGTFGSGFVWYAQNGKPYIVTNRHVVADYTSVSVTFENDDGSSSEFKDLKIAYSDELLDIAVISLPDSFRRAGLLFAQKTVSDGDDVFSAGFPALGNEPGWQLGKGVVSNSRAKIKELVNPDISVIIQHTAQIDGGNSGGPLLIRDSQARSGYRVVGINTWKAVSRQDTNFAIPVRAAEKALNVGLSSKSAVPFEQRATAFIKAVSEKDSFTDVLPFVSNSMISEFGEKALRDVLSKAPSSVRTYVSDAFEYNPIEGMRTALAWRIYELSRPSDESVRLNLVRSEEESTGVQAAFSAGQKEIGSFWSLEQGNYRITEFDGIQKSASSGKKKTARSESGSAFSFQDPFQFALSGGYVNVLSEGKHSFIAQGEVSYNFVALGVMVLQDYLTVEKEVDSFSDKTESGTERASNLEFFFDVRVPLKIDRVLVMPFGELHAGLSIGSGLESAVRPITGGVGGGVQLAWCTDSGFAPFLGAKYLMHGYSQDVGGSAVSHDIALFAGIKFIER